MLCWLSVILPIDPQVLDDVIVATKSKIENEFNDQPYCEGRLSTSALSTAVSCIALQTIDAEKYGEKIYRALNWLLEHINEDGGWGDSVKSPSNLSTSLLCWAALKNHEGSKLCMMEEYLSSKLGLITPENIISSLAKIYGEDKTFAVPICMALSIRGRFGEAPKCWKWLDALPFELAAAPQSWYPYFKMNVVSYAIPALISIGILKHKKDPAVLPLKWIRSSLVDRCLNKLRAVQPNNGGFLEAVPLTGFTAMALFTAGYKDHDVLKKAESFLSASILEDGSSPIDTNLCCWVTSLSLQTLSNTKTKLDLEQVKTWLSRCQWKTRDPYAGAAPGGWAWTPLPGGVPDADDTSAALLALMMSNYREILVLKHGVNWLLKLQNNDGGMPTFCRGWGQLPFDQSCTDITAHALRVFDLYGKLFPHEVTIHIQSAVDKAVEFLRREQRTDGSWLPLWFGSQDHPHKKNPVYGTSKVLLALKKEQPSMRDRGLDYLLSVQQEDGGFGGHKHGKASIEETGLALKAMCQFDRTERACELAVDWLIQHTKGGTEFIETPIGLYFASLWYSEKMYPIIFSCDGLLTYKEKINKN